MATANGNNLVTLFDVVSGKTDPDYMGVVLEQKMWHL